jgi:hypothetical protein
MEKRTKRSRAAQRRRERRERRRAVVWMEEMTSERWGGAGQGGGQIFTQRLILREMLWTLFRRWAWLRVVDFLPSRRPAVRLKAGRLLVRHWLCNVPIEILRKTNFLPHFLRKSQGKSMLCAENSRNQGAEQELKFLPESQIPPSFFA